MSLAIDRRAVVAAAGGAHAARLTCHMLPPGFPGYRPDCPSAPDLAAARRLVARSGTRGARVVLWTGANFGFLTRPLTRALRSLGYHTTVRRVTGGGYFGRVYDSSSRAQAGPSVWVADYPSSANFLGIFSCRSFVPRNPDNQNVSEFCDPGADALMRRATELQATDPRAADALWVRVERRVLRAAPAVPLINPVDSHLVSARVRNDRYGPQLPGFLPDQAWVR